MLKKENFSYEHIMALRGNTTRDPALLERSVYAFGLLEALTRSGLPFIFKGGSSLMLLLDHPMRLSTDIDIIVSPKIEVEPFIEKTAESFPFKRFEEQMRKGKNQIVKRHFRFFYDSPVNKKEFFIILDVVFEESHYPELIKKPLENELLLFDNNPVEIVLPGIDCILADKLTAFAPHTTGIPLNTGKDLEVLKQFYDICTLLDVFKDFEMVKDTYSKICSAEIAYRDGRMSVSDTLKDTFYSALTIACRGTVNAEEYSFYVKGIRDLRNHLFQLPYTPEIVAPKAVGVMLLALSILSGRPFKRIQDPRQYLKRQLKSRILSVNKNLRNLVIVSPVSYAYLTECDTVLQIIGEENLK